MRGILVLAILALISLPRPARADPDRGAEVVRTGAPHVLNPAHPLKKPETVALRELWRIGGDSDREGEFFGLIGDLAVDGAGILYVLDSQLARVGLFTSDGDFVRAIGREGEGPGELRRPWCVYLSPDGLVCLPQVWPSRVVRLRPTGEPAAPLILPEDRTGVAPQLSEVRRAGDHVVALCASRPGGPVVEAGERTTILSIDALDESGHPTVRYHEERYASDESAPVWEERSRALRRRWDVAPDGRVCVAASFQDYRIAVMAPDGTLLRVIEREYEHRRRSRAEKQAVLDWATVNPDGNLPGTRFEIEDLDRDVMELHCRGDGTVWVLTSRGRLDRPEGSLGVFDVFDRDGRFVRQVALLGEGDPERDRYYFLGDRLYVTTCFRAAVATMVGGGADSRFARQCEAPMEVICYRIGTDD